MNSLTSTAGISPTSEVYLRENVKVEPLVCHWHAWPHLIPPAQLGLNLLNRYLPALKSFITNPRIHVAASQNPAMFGGPFVDLPLGCVDDIKNLYSRTEQEQAELLELAKAYLATEKALLASASGYSLGSYYTTTSSALSGAVEYVYDMANRPAVRLIEPILYGSVPLSSAQTILIHDTAEGQRPFFLNTPRFEDSKSVMVAAPFDDERLDAVAKARSSPHLLGELIELLNLERPQAHRFSGFFTTRKPDDSWKVPKSGEARLRYFGHASIVIETESTSIAIDPIIAYKEDEGDERFTYSDLPPKIDYLVITHCHQDHFSPETLLQIRHKVGTVIVPRNNGGSIADPSMHLILKSLGYRHIISVDEFERVDFPQGSVTSLPFLGEHSDLNIRSKHSVFVELAGLKCLFLVDSDIRDPRLLEKVSDHLGGVDLVFLGMECNGAPLSWLYGPLLTNPISRQNDESRRLSASDADGALRIAETFPGAEVFVYAMGQEPWLKFMMGLEYNEHSVQILQIEQFMAAAASRNIPVTVLNQKYERLFGRC